MELYLETIGEEPTCNWCGALCRSWGIGHWIDRQDSKGKHTPDNSVACCSPCNYHKGHKTTESHKGYLGSLLRSCPMFPSGTGLHPWGKIPWGDYPSSSKRFKRVFAPDLSAYEIAHPQTEFSFFVVAR